MSKNESNNESNNKFENESDNKLNEKLNYKSAISYLYKFIKPHERWYLTATVISLVLVGTGLLNARVTQILVDSSISGEVSKIVSSLILFLIIVATNITLSYISGICVSKLSANASMDLKNHIIKILLGAKYGETIKLKSGDTLSTINSDTGIVCDFIAGDLIGLFSQFSMAFGAIIYLFCINPSLALVTFAYTPIGMFFTLSLNHKMNKLYPLNADNKGEALSVVEQALSQILVIKSFMMEKQIKKKIRNQYDNVYKTEMKISVWNSLLQTACSSTSQIPRTSFIIFAGYMVMNHNLTVGAFVAIFELINLIIGPSVYFPFMLNRFNNSIASINRIRRLENIPQTENAKKVMPSTTSNITGTSNVPAININNISFSYSDSNLHDYSDINSESNSDRNLHDNFILQDFSLFHSGSGIIAICGDSGSGKTTLLDLIAGLYPPKCGSVNTIGDVSVVSQDTYLFNASLMENTRYARINATDEEVIEALVMAGADEFAKALPYGYNTMLGDGNSDLSGGQKQRISLARIILTNNPIWLLDEPTSALDAQTENIILDVICKMSKDKLIIISAHRKSLIDIADKVVNLNNADRVVYVKGVEGL